MSPEKSHIFDTRHARRCWKLVVCQKSPMSLEKSHVFDARHTRRYRKLVVCQKSLCMFPQKSFSMFPHKSPMSPEKSHIFDSKHIRRCWKLVVCQKTHFYVSTKEPLYDSTKEIYVSGKEPCIWRKTHTQVLEVVRLMLQSDNINVQGAAGELLCSLFYNDSARTQVLTHRTYRALLWKQRAFCRNVGLFCFFICSAVYTCTVMARERRCSRIEYIKDFCGNVGFVCGNVGLFCFSVASSTVTARERMRSRIGNIKFFCGNVGLCCRNVGLSCGNLGLSYGNVGLSCGNVGLSCGNVGRSCGYVGLYCENVSLCGFSFNLFKATVCELKCRAFLRKCKSLLVLC